MDRNVKTGKATSCGCYRKERQHAQKYGLRHGLSLHRLYQTWNGMMHRCYDETHVNYQYYGGRGINVCPRWHFVENFIADMEPTFAEGLELDRFPNKDGNYEISNCRWATLIDQNNNRSNNTVFEHEGKRLSIAQWAREVGVSQDVMGRRLHSGKPPR